MSRNDELPDLRSRMTMSRVLVLAVVILTTVATYSIGLSVQFELKDDHNLIRLASPNSPHHQIPATPSLISQIKADALGHGRVRPLHWLPQYAFSPLAGANTGRWHAIVLVYAVVSASLLFAAGLRLFQSTASAGLFAICIMQCPEPGPTLAWARLGPGESVGMVFLSAALYCVSRVNCTHRPRTWQWLAFAGWACSSLVKESFLLTAPALVFLTWTLERRDTPSWQATFRELLRVAIPYIAWTALVGTSIAVTLRLAPARSYATVYAPQTFDDWIAVLLTILQQIPNLAVWLLPVVVAALNAFFRKSQSLQKRIVSAVVFTLLWVVPQVLLYSTRNEMTQHYWLPAVVGLSFLNAAAFATLLHHQSWRWVKWGLAFVIVVWLARSVQVNVTTLVNLRNRTLAVADAVESVVCSVPSTGNIVLVAKPSEYEEALTFLCLVGLHGRQSVNVYLHDPDASSGIPVAWPEANTPAGLQSGDVDAVVYLTPRCMAFPRRTGWYDPDHFQLRHCSQEQYFFSLRAIAWEAFEYSMDVELPRGVLPPSDVNRMPYGAG